MTEAEFAARAAQLGLALSADDLAKLHRGWVGMQPQLARLHAVELAAADRPAHVFAVPE